MTNLAHECVDRPHLPCPACLASEKILRFEGYAIIQGNEIQTPQGHYMDYSEYAICPTKEEAERAFSGAEFRGEDGYHIEKVRIEIVKEN